MANSRVSLLIVLFIIGGFLIGFPLFTKEHYLLLSIVIMLVAFLPFAYYFTKQAISTRELVMLAMLGAISAISRIPFAALPSVQPSSFVIIITGLVLGPQSGFVVGVLTALVSNMVLGQGPWTPWQMFAWGMMGLCAGLFNKMWVMRSVIGRALYGFIWGFLFGWIMNLWFIMLIVKEFTWELILPFYLASFTFDLAHGLTNVILLVLFSRLFMKVLERFKGKYGLFIDK